MIYAFLILALLCAALIGLCLRLLGQLDTQAKEFALERGGLLQRIQSPERAVVDHSRGDEPRQRYKPVPLDDDDAMAEAHGEEVSDDGDS